MVVDLLLRILGENPDSPEFYDSTDKWTEVVYGSFELLRTLLPILLFALPFLWLLWRRHKNKKTTGRDIILTIACSLLLLLLGIFLPDFIIELIAGIGVNQLYGN